MDSIILLLFLLVATFGMARVFYSMTFNTDLQPLLFNSFTVLAPSVNSISLGMLIKMAHQAEDASETIRNFYQFKYDQITMIIKGLSAAVIALLTPLIERVYRDGTDFQAHDLSLIAVVFILLVGIILSTIAAKRCHIEYAHNLQFYYLLK